MKVLVIGSGGREHALALKLVQSAKVTHVFVAPGNGGIQGEKLSQVPLKETQINELIEFVKAENVHLTLVGPEAPLVEGIVNRFEAEGLAIIGASKEAAQLEGSKAFSKEFMQRHNIPTAAYKAFTEFEPAVAYVRNQNQYPVVIKADGLAAGKGVIIAQNEQEACEALDQCLVRKTFASAGQKVVIEQFLVGQEVSVIAFCDGCHVLPLLPVQDHKTIGEGDTGPNTGGMGTYCPTPLMDEALWADIRTRILEPTVHGMKSDGMPFKGILFAGLMISPNREPYTLEYNVRFGDPETQVLMAMLDTDLVDILEAIKFETLDKLTLTWKPGYAVCVVAAAQGYPSHYSTGHPIILSPLPEQVQCIHAGTKLSPKGQLLTAGGRVLSIVAQAETLETAIQRAYTGMKQVRFEGMYFRTDIAKKALVGQLN